MSETKEQIAEQRDELLRANETLHTQLAAAGRPVGAYQPTRFLLTEGDRQELEIFGVATIGGRLLTIDQVRAKLAGTDQANVPLADPPAATDRRAELGALLEPGRAGGIRGFDYVYPSVAPGQIDPKVAGTPGISGPAAVDELAE